MGSRNRFFNFGQRRKNRFTETPALEPLKPQGLPFPREGRFAQAQRNPQNRNLKLANLFAIASQSINPEGAIGRFAGEVAQGRTAEAVRRDRFAAFQEGRQPQISTFGLGPEKVGEIERDVTSRFQFEQTAQAQAAQATAQIQSREAISNADRIAAQTRIETQIDALADSRQAQTENSRVQAELAGLRIDQIQFPDVGLKAQELALKIDNNSGGLLGYSESLFQAYTQLETQGRVPAGTTDKLFPGRIFKVTGTEGAGDKTTTTEGKDEKIPELSPSEKFKEAGKQFVGPPSPSQTELRSRQEKIALELVGARISIRPGVDEFTGEIGTPKILVTGISPAQRQVIEDFTDEELNKFIQEENKKRSNS